MSICTLLFLVFLVLKLTLVIDWHWLLICAPLIFQAIVWFGFVIIASIGAMYK